MPQQPYDLAQLTDEELTYLHGKYVEYQTRFTTYGERGWKRRLLTHWTTDELDPLAERTRDKLGLDGLRRIRGPQLERWIEERNT